MKQNMEPQHPSQSPRRRLENSLREEFGRNFLEYGFEHLANPSELGFFPFPEGFTSPSLPGKDMTSTSPAIHFPINFADRATNGFSSSNRNIVMAHSPARSNVSSTSDLHPFRVGSNSMFLSPKLPSKSFHNTLGSNLKNLTDLDDNDLGAPGPDEDLSLMWNDDPCPRPTKDEIQSPIAIPKTARNLNIEYEDPEENYFSNFTPFEDSRRPVSMVAQMDRMYARAQNAENPSCSMSGNPNQETLDTRPDANSNSVRNFPSKKAEFFHENINQNSMTYDYSNEFDLRNDPRAKNIRGLRALSLQVKAHVAMVGETTYKDVAEYLTKEVNERLANDPNASANAEKGDEQNVKRRVYDALNVLIATDVLRKEGKKVFCNPNAELVGIPKRRELTIQKDRMTRKNEDKKRRIQEKLKVMREMTLKYLAIKNLIERNKETEEKSQDVEEEEDVDSDNHTEASCTTTIKELGVKTPKELNKSSALHFPFLVVKGSSQPSVMNLFMNNSRKMASIQSKSQLNIFGDTDVLFKLKLHYVSKELFNNVLPEEIHKFIPAAYMDGLK